MRQRSQATELLDVHARPDAALAGNLRDLARINRWTGGLWLLERALANLVGEDRGGRFTLLDVGGGAADTVAAVQEWAHRRGRRCDGIVLDRSASVLCIAEQRPHPLITLVLGAGEALPLADRSVDVASCSLVLHHCSDQEAVQLLAEMGRVARVGIIVDDLIRSRLGYAGAVALASLATRNPLTRHDAPLSVCRAFTQRELATLLAKAGLAPAWQMTLPGYRTVVAARPFRPASERDESQIQRSLSSTGAV